MAKKPTFARPKKSPFAPKGPAKPARAAGPARPTPFAPPAAGARSNRFAPTAGIGDEGFPLAPPAPKGKRT